MTVSRDTFGLSDTGLPLLRDLVRERTGLSYDDRGAETLRDRLAPLVLERGFHSFLDFYYLLKYDDPSASAEWRRVMDALSVQETYFWREIDQVQALVSHVVPALAAQDPRRPIRVWSVPCATGEEPLTIAMALDDAGWFERVPIEIHASDASASALAKARAGLYRERSFRALPARLREKYFVDGPSGATPVPALAGRITSWSLVNLMAREEVAAYVGTPVIFCRNAFIYFSSRAIAQVVNAFADTMPSPGYLFVGVSESLLRITDRFTLEEIDHAFVYVKR
jgi:chemotaxis protein methyltransferase CheR